MPVQQREQSQARTSVSPGPTTSQGSGGDLADPLARSELGDSLGDPIQMLADPSVDSSSAPPPGGGDHGGSTTGLPPALKSGVEQLSGLSMDGVDVHRNSSKPAEMDAHAYAQGTDIHLGPGREADLPHETWHVAQQMQGRVGANTQKKGQDVNDSGHLESEATAMGRKALQVGSEGGGGGPVRAAPARGGVAQLRGENPHAKSADHQGWTTTAHHIVAHSTLGNALEKLDGPQKAEVLKAAIPTTITKDMVANLKCAVDDTAEARAELRAKLVSTAPDTEEFKSVRLGDMRMSFFEWQGGNQFQGPNTSIRAEPTSSKDDIDYDGIHFNGMSKEEFEALTDIGEALPGLEDTETIKAKLISMLSMTKDRPVASFDAGKWQEITSSEELASLASSEGLDRKHIEKYAWFRVAASAIGEDGTWPKIVPKMGGEYHYDGVKIPTFQLKGTDGYFPVDGAKSVKPTTNETKKLPKVLSDSGVVIEEPVDDTKHVLIPVGGAVKEVGKKFTVEGYDLQIPFVAKVSDKLKVGSPGTELEFAL